MFVGPVEYKLHMEYVVALEATRRDLMSVNEELREKIGALERGQEVLQQKNGELRSSLAHAMKQWKDTQSELQQEKYEHAQTLKGCRASESNGIHE